MCGCVAVWVGGRRAEIYTDNVAFIKRHNALFVAGNVSYELGVNEFSDLSHAEFKQRFLESRFPSRARNDVRWDRPKLHVTLAGEPDAVDWRDHGAVTPVKNQGSCGGCWAFSTTGSTEGRVQIRTGKLLALSEQQLIDCSGADGNNGCAGGEMDNGFQYIINNGGINNETGYPYQGRNGVCSPDKQKAHAATLRSFKDVPGNEAALAAAVATGPVSVAIEADQRGIQSYKSGIFSGPCGQNLDHGVLVVGYGKGYWIVKNSWGTSWGMDGYIKLARGGGKIPPANSPGICGIAMQASYPVAGSTPRVTQPAPLARAEIAGRNYRNPNESPCADREDVVQITSIGGSFCAPKCSKEPGGTDMVCPQLKSAGAEGKCLLELQDSNITSHCALECDAERNCPQNASCKLLAGTGICTFDDDAYEKAVADVKSIGAGGGHCSTDDDCQMAGECRAHHCSWLVGQIADV